MDCIKFQKNISNFFDEQLEYEQLSAFIAHAKNCADCYDELEIFYMAQIGLEDIEQDPKASYNFKEGLENIILDNKKYMDIIFKSKIGGKLIYITAAMFTVIIFGFQLLFWFDVF